MEQTPSAGPIQIVSITEDHKFVLDEKKLKQILFHKRAKGKKVKSMKYSLVNHIIHMYLF